MVGCISWNKKKKAKSQPVYKSESGVPFNDTNFNLDSARGGPGEAGGTPKAVAIPIATEEPDHAPPGLLQALCHAHICVYIYRTDMCPDICCAG